LPEPANYVRVSVPGRITKKQLIRLVMRRWRTERVYEDLKGELGLDHMPPEVTDLVPCAPGPFSSPLRALTQ